jgi:hypothetical protein
MKNKKKKNCSQLSTCFIRHMGFRSKVVLRAGGKTETTQENIQDWLQLDEGDPGFQLLTE